MRIENDMSVRLRSNMQKKNIRCSVYILLVYFKMFKESFGKMTFPDKVGGV